MNYNEAASFLFSLGRFGIKLGTETISAMLDGVGRPETKFQSIHLAGTNGKGSVAAMLSAVLTRSGYSV
ncbi:MAG: bifunctional folylpolyglutamate synthase/dihydrofolate synthase, partial [Deltaproteobacteria bacterium]|nr:bifunctional folylpolyglutamate synthase/dihydrofolate synthase [Deltaproteobacteria bacterium]